MTKAWILLQFFSILPAAASITSAPAVAGDSLIPVQATGRGLPRRLAINLPVQRQYLKPAEVGVTQEMDGFGHAVAVSGDTLVIGAPFEDGGATGVNGQPDEEVKDSGAAYVFVRNAGVWTQQAYLKPAAGVTAYMRFGFSVAASGDSVVVGAPAERSSATGVNGKPDTLASNAGAAYVFVRSGTNWTQEAYLKPAAVGRLQVGDYFGNSVAISGNTVIVGAPYEGSSTIGVNSRPNEDAQWAGTAYIFVRKGATWAQEAYLKPAEVGGTQAGDYFGHSVAVSGDTVVVGAPMEDSSTTGVNSVPDEGALDSGAAYVFARSGTNWTQQAYLKSASVGTARKLDWFGWSVAVSGDRVAVGVPYENSGDSLPDDNISGGGAAYVFTRSGLGWSQEAYLKPNRADFSQESFGYSVAVSGGRVVVGSPQESSSTTGVNSTPNRNAAGAGAAYVFLNRAGAWAQQAYLKPAVVGLTQERDSFGWSVAVSGDTALIGAVQEDGGKTGVGTIPDEASTDSGAAYAFFLDAPQIRVEQPAGARLTNGGSQADFGATLVGDSTDLTFTVLNAGALELVGLGLTLSGADGSQFFVACEPAGSLQPGASTTFTVGFRPASLGTKTATLHVASNDPDHDPFSFALVGTTPGPTGITVRGNEFILRFGGTTGRRYRVRHSLDLTGGWEDFAPPALYTAPANGHVSHTDVNPPNTLRFYRAELEP